MAPVLLDPDKFNGKQLTCATAYYESGELVDALSKIAGKEVKYVEGITNWKADVPPEMAKAAEETRDHMSKWEYYGPTGPEDLKWTLAQINDKDGLTTWEDFVASNGPWFPSNQ